MRLTADRWTGRPFVRVAAACLLAAAAIPVAACGTRTVEVDTALRDKVLAHERLIADCMHDRGFDYTVGVPRSLLAEEARRRAEAEGGDVDAVTRQALAQAPDPNDEVLTRMSPSQQAKWGDALWGDGGHTGCYDSTYARAWGVSLDDLAVKGQEFLAEVEKDPAMAPAVREYVRCMAKRGHTLSHPRDVEATIGREAAKLDEAAAEAYGSKAMADHQTCVAPYDRKLAETYDRLSAQK
jgi:hypothetical protein